LLAIKHNNDTAYTTRRDAVDLAILKLIGLKFACARPTAIMANYNEVTPGLGAATHANFQNKTAGDIAAGVTANAQITDNNGAILSRLMLKELITARTGIPYFTLNGDETTTVTNMDDSNGANVRCALNRAILKLTT